MTKWQVDTYTDPEALAAAVEALDDTIQIQIIPFPAGSGAHFMLIRAGGS
jgi:hypothetical protein